MPVKKGSKVVYFSKVKEAREALKNKAVELYELQLTIIRDALAAQDFEVAMKANQWLIEHMPGDDSGTKMIEQSIDKPKETTAVAGPSINIGFALGGNSSKTKLLPPIDVEPSDGTDE